MEEERKRPVGNKHAKRGSSFERRTNRKGKRNLISKKRKLTTWDKGIKLEHSQYQVRREKKKGGRERSEGKKKKGAKMVGNDMMKGTVRKSCPKKQQKFAGGQKGALGTWHPYKTLRA